MREHSITSAPLAGEGRRDGLADAREAPVTSATFPSIRISMAPKLRPWTRRRVCLYLGRMVNRLADETSPYLRQHGDNPVDWYPWGDEAFDAAAAPRTSPILLSVGYSACHWCHVMAHESFEDAETAAVMNELFVNVKVDREERPDVDAIYMDAVQAMTGRGGWPMTVFLTPDGRPVLRRHVLPARAAVPAELRRLCRASTTCGATAATILGRRPPQLTDAIGDGSQRREPASERARRRGRSPRRSQQSGRQRSTPSGAASAGRRSSRRR